MSLMANAKFELFRDAKLQVFYDVQRTWYELYKVQKDISISEKNIEILKLIERLALVRFKSASLGNSGTSSQSTATSSVQSAEQCRFFRDADHGCWSEQFRFFRIKSVFFNADWHNGIIIR